MIKSKDLLQLGFLLTMFFTISILCIHSYKANEKNIELVDVINKNEKRLVTMAKDNFFVWNNFINTNMHIKDALKNQTDTTVVMFIIRAPICLSCFERFLTTLEITELPIFIITDIVGYSSINKWFNLNDSKCKLVIVNSNELSRMSSYTVVVLNRDKDLYISLDKDYPSGLLQDLIYACQ